MTMSVWRLDPRVVRVFLAAITAGCTSPLAGGEGRAGPEATTAGPGTDAAPVVALVVGFGAFDGVDENPAGALARAIDGREGRTPRGRVVRIVGREIPVSYARGVEETVAAARAVHADFVVGVGVDGSRDDVYAEAIALGASGAYADVDGVVRDALVGVSPPTLPVPLLAARLEAPISTAPGDYVCNAWLWDAPRALAPVPAGFVHVPSRGMSADRMTKALLALADDLQADPAR